MQDLNLHKTGLTSTMPASRIAAVSLGQRSQLLDGLTSTDRNTILAAATRRRFFANSVITNISHLGDLAPQLPFPALQRSPRKKMAHAVPYTSQPALRYVYQSGPAAPRNLRNIALDHRRQKKTLADQYLPWGIPGRAGYAFQSRSESRRLVSAAPGVPSRVITCEWSTRASPHPHKYLNLRGGALDHHRRERGEGRQPISVPVSTLGSRSELLGMMARFFLHGYW